MLSNLAIAQKATLKPIAEIAAQMGLHADDFDTYGSPYVAKLRLSALELAHAPEIGGLGVLHGSIIAIANAPAFDDVTHRPLLATLSHNLFRFRFAKWPRNRPFAQRRRVFATIAA